MLITKKLNRLKADFHPRFVFPLHFPFKMLKYFKLKVVSEAWNPILELLALGLDNGKIMVKAIDRKTCWKVTPLAFL